MQTFLITFIVFLVTVSFFIFWASTGTNLKLDSEQPFINQASKEDFDISLTIGSWNIAWGYGMGSEGVNYAPKDKEHFLKALDDIVSVISSKDCDIVLLQEVDFGSRKSHGVDQLKYLADELGMNYAYAPSWKVNYLPFPYWPISSHFGRVYSGGAILSKYPIEKNRVVLHPKPKSNPWHYNLFYLSRYTQIVDVKIKNKTWSIFNNHLEAFAKKNRVIQAKEMVKFAKEESDLLVLGGDLNTTPTVASKKGSFPGYEEDDYENDPTYSIIAGIDGIKDALSTEEYLKDESRWFSFSSVRADRKLDYIFVNEMATVEEFEVLKVPVSDHYPLFAKIRLN